MKVWRPEGGVPIKAWTDGVPIEDQAIEQLENVARLPFIHHHLAVMPDVHWGLGATIGSVIPTVGAIVPAAVGVDVGCGMRAERLSIERKDLSDDLSELREMIEAAVPHGRTDDGGANDRGAWCNVPEVVERTWTRRLAVRYECILEETPEARHRRPLEQLGTLGSGNHFVEVCVDGHDRVWIVLHSGSRGPGNRLASTFIKKAKAEMGRWFVELPDPNLAYLVEGTREFGLYIQAVRWAQEYAKLNRSIMMSTILARLARDYSACGQPVIGGTPPIDCNHNGVAKERHYKRETWVTRKGATHAGEGTLGIIPGSMGAQSYIVSGLGNRESFNSCSHGAGRAMGRRQARDTFTLEDHAKATEGIECRKDDGVLDETPGAYKSIEAVMAAQQDLVEVLYVLRQVVCVKG